ncbi:MoxR family ATPase, partial [bacterium]|nr:MoxR family ATPase [bacterium]
SQKLAEGAIEVFYRLRQVAGIEKKPATRELLHWIRALSTDPQFDVKHLKAKAPLPLLGLLFKKSDDLSRAQRVSLSGF